MTCAAAESGAVGKRERRLVTKFRDLVGTRCRRRLPAQIVLPSTEHILLDTHPGHGLPEPMRFLSQKVRIAKGGVTRMQTDLVPPVVDAGQQSLNDGFLERIAAIEFEAALAGLEEERNRGRRGSLIDVHNPIDGRKKGVLGIVLASKKAIGEVRDALSGKTRIAIFQCVAGNMAGEKPDAVARGAVRMIDVATDLNTKSAWPAPQARPQRCQTGP